MTTEKRYVFLGIAAALNCLAATIMPLASLLFAFFIIGGWDYAPLLIMTPAGFLLIIVLSLSIFLGFAVAKRSKLLMAISLLLILFQEIMYALFYRGG